MAAALLLFALSGNTLVWYDFESDGVETGPYTLSIFEGASGSVSLSSLYRYSGFRSVEIRDVAGDGEFAELQGFFSDKWSGRILFHFALLVAEAEEPFNVALAGISHFSMREHGIGFWMKGRNGSLYPVWQDDPRFSALMASIGLARKDLDEAGRWLEGDVDAQPRWLDSPSVRALWSEDLAPRLVDAVKAEFPSEWHDLVRDRLEADIRFFVLLWQKRYPEALAFARRMAALQLRMKLSPGRWLERAGDASFHEGDYPGALAGYEESRRGGNEAESILLKLSDVHFKLGNFELERSYREKVYGRLE